MFFCFCTESESCGWIQRQDAGQVQIGRVRRESIGTGTSLSLHHLQGGKKTLTHTLPPTHTHAHSAES